MDYSKLSNTELHRLEGDRATSPDQWRGAIAEIAKREAAANAYTPIADRSAHAPSPRRWNAGGGSGSPVILVGFDVPFWDLVRWMVKVSLASIPATLITIFLIFSFAVAMSVFFGGSITAMRSIFHR